MMKTKIILNDKIFTADANLGLFLRQNMIIIHLLLLLTSLTIYAQPYQNFPLQYQTKPIYRVSNPKTYYVPLRDGVHLAVDVYLPKGKPQQKFPTLLYQTRYWRGIKLIFPFSLIKKMVPSTRNFDVVQLVKYGYALVCVDVRGTGASEGKKTSALSGLEEMHDAQDIIEWILKQEWSDGKIGTFGISYIGMAAQMTLFNFHPAVKACAPMYAGFDYYDDISLSGGVFNHKLNQDWNKFCKSLDQNQLPALKSTFFNELLSQNVRPVKGHKKKLKEILKTRNNWYYDSEAWSIAFIGDKRTVNQYVAVDSILSPHMLDYRKVQVPILAYTGWWDASFTKGSIKIFKNYPNPNNQLVIGPWRHGGEFCIDEQYLGPTKFNHIAPVLQFFDIHLKNQSIPLDTNRKVIYWTINQNQWKTAHQFPPANIQHKSFSLTSQNRIHQMDSLCTNGTCTRYNLDFKTAKKHLPDRKPLDQNKLVIDFYEVPEDLIITGIPTLRLKLKTQNPDPKIFAVLEEILPDGKVKYITEGAFRAIHRKVYQHPLYYEYQPPYHSYTRADSSLMPSEQFEWVEYNLEPISYLVKKGSKLRLALSSSELQTFQTSVSDVWEIHRDSEIWLPIEF